MVQGRAIKFAFSFSIRPCDPVFSTGESRRSLSDNFSSVLKSQQQTNGSRAAGHAAQLIASAVAAALQDPEFIVRIAAGRQHGGARQRSLTGRTGVRLRSAFNATKSFSIQNAKRLLTPSPGDICPGRQAISARSVFVLSRVLSAQLPRPTASGARRPFVVGTNWPSKVWLGPWDATHLQHDQLKLLILLTRKRFPKP
jgi:hypothetical protein